MGGVGLRMLSLVWLMSANVNKIVTLIQPVENHFEDYLEMVKLGSGTERPFDKYFDEQPLSGVNFVELEIHIINQAA